jgi:hypothetical protein
MGQKKGLIYNSIVLSFLFVLWYFTTSKPGFSPPYLPEVIQEESTLDLSPMDLTILIISNPVTSLPNDVELKLISVGNTFSHFFDLTINLKCRSSLSPEKIKNESQSSKKAKLLIFFISPEAPLTKSHIIHVLPSSVSDIPNYLISYLRETLKLPPTIEPLTNGLSSSEESSKETLINKWQDWSIYRQVKIFNKMIDLNQLKVSQATLKTLETLKKALSNELHLEKSEILSSLTSLNASPDLSQEEYFKWDFKVGVYAPIFFPVLFPISGAIYSRLFLRK